MLLLAIIELSLVICGVGRDLSLVVRVPGDPTALPWQLNAHADQPHFGRRDLGGPETRRFELPKPNDVYRVMVVGGSTVYGFPYPPELAFPRQLEIMLGRQWDDRRIEVLNGGMIAVGSTTVADVVAQSLDADPDLIIVHTGHNEFYGPGGAASTAATFPASVSPLIVGLKRTRLIQTVESWFRQTDNSAELMETLPADLAIPMDGSVFQSAVETYRENLRRIVRTTQSAGVPLLLTSVASNLRDHSPVRISGSSGLSKSEQSRWDELLADAGRQVALKEWAAAEQSLRAAKGISGESAVLEYRRAQCREGRGHLDEARNLYERARDLDGCRFRAPGAFRQVVADVAAESQIPFLDIAEQLKKRAAPDTPGYDLFLEHVHYSLKGHHAVASLLTTSVVSKLAGEAISGDVIPEFTEMQRLLGAIPQDDLVAFTYAFQVFDLSPMNSTLDVERHREYLLSLMQSGFADLSPGQQEVFASLSVQQMGIDLLRFLGDGYRRTGRDDDYLQTARLLGMRRPWDAQAQIRLATALQATGQPSQKQWDRASQLKSH